jgi:hypothetical protein
VRYPKKEYTFKNTFCPVWEEMSYDYTKMKNETEMKQNIYAAVPEIPEF